MKNLTLFLLALLPFISQAQKHEIGLSQGINFATGINVKALYGSGIANYTSLHYAYQRNHKQLGIRVGLTSLRMGYDPVGANAEGDYAFYIGLKPPYDTKHKNEYVAHSAIETTVFLNYLFDMHNSRLNLGWNMGILANAAREEEYLIGYRMFKAGPQAGYTYFVSKHLGIGAEVQPSLALHQNHYYGFFKDKTYALFYCPITLQVKLRL